MFAYCGNNPTSNNDYTGYAEKPVLRKEFEGCGSVGVAGAGLLIIPLLKPVADAGVNLFEVTLREVRAIADALKSRHKSKTDDQQPRIHHIVPTGNFSHYSISTQQQLKELHTILYNAGIDVAYSPDNLVIVSQGYHKSLHTAAYIDMIYIIISPYANSSSFEVKIALRTAALIISSGDTYSFWEVFW